MELRSLGQSGLFVSRFALGTMTWGRDTDIADAREQLIAYLDAGGTFIDTADVYAEGVSESMVGELLESLGVRDRVVIATKAVSQPNTVRRFNASRGHILRCLDESLRRLRVDSIDVWQLHAPDPLTPIEETLGALTSAVSSGKVRYVGVSNYAGWQLAQAHALQSGSIAPIISTQMEYSLLERGIEREVVPASLELGIGILPWSPLGRGVLTGKYRHGMPSTSRASSDHFSRFVSLYLDDRHRRVVDAVATAAEGLGVAPLEVALAWVRDQPGVTAPILGARTVDQLTAALAADSITLPAEISDALGEVSAPHVGYPDHGWAQGR